MLSIDCHRSEQDRYRTKSVADGSRSAGKGVVESPSRTMLEDEWGQKDYVADERLSQARQQLWGVGTECDSATLWSRRSL